MVARVVFLPDSGIAKRSSWIALMGVIFVVACCLVHWPQDQLTAADKEKLARPVFPAIGKVNMERRPVGSFTSKEQILVQRGPDGWKRIGLN
jgi:hypothetical protein